MVYTFQPLMIWLYEKNSQIDSCKTLNKAFSTTLHPDWNPDNPISIDFDGNLRSYKGNAIEVCSCSDEDFCADYLEENKARHVFLVITKPSYEDCIIKFADVFARPYETSHVSTYLLCTDSNKAKNDLGTNQQYIKIFVDETALLATLTFTIADYFINRGQQQLDYNTYKTISQARKYFHWAKTLFERTYDLKSFIETHYRILNAEKQLTTSEHLLEKITNYKDDETRMDADMNLIEFSSREGEQYLFSSNESIDKLFLKTMRTEIEKEILSEQTPTSDIDVHFLDFSFSREISQNIMPILSQFFGKNLKVLQEEKGEYDQLLERTDSPIIVLALSTYDNELLLEKLCSHDQSPSIYLFGSEPTTKKEKEIFFNKYHSICGMSNNPDDLAAQIAIDVAMKNHILGNQYARENNKNCGENNYDQCIEILNQLDNFSKKNVDNGH